MTAGAGLPVTRESCLHFRHDSSCWGIADSATNKVVNVWVNVYEFGSICFYVSLGHESCCSFFALSTGYSAST